MNLKILIYIVVFSISTLNFYGQSKQFKANGHIFSFVTDKVDNLEGSEDEVVHLYRGNKKLLSHTTSKQEGDCSSVNIQLGNYSIIDNEIIFYSYWAATDRMPGPMLPYGFRKQIYAVDSVGLLHLREATIYIEDYVEKEDKSFFEDNGWKHKGLKHLNKAPQNKAEQELLFDYIQSIERKYNAEFVLSVKKKSLEEEVRRALQSEIQEHTKDWVEGEVYGKVKK